MGHRRGQRAEGAGVQIDAVGQRRNAGAGCVSNSWAAPFTVHCLLFTGHRSILADRQPLLWLQRDDQRQHQVDTNVPKDTKPKATAK